jgi:hypothetical protein
MIAIKSYDLIVIIDDPQCPELEIRLQSGRWERRAAGMDTIRGRGPVGWCAAWDHPDPAAAQERMFQVEVVDLAHQPQRFRRLRRRSKVITGAGDIE